MWHVGVSAGEGLPAAGPGGEPTSLSGFRLCALSVMEFGLAHEVLQAQKVLGLCSSLMSHQVHPQPQFLPFWRHFRKGDI